MSARRFRPTRKRRSIYSAEYLALMRWIVVLAAGLLVAIVAALLGVVVRQPPAP